MHKFEEFTSAVIPITGAASGIGLAIAIQLRRFGAKPILLDVDAARLRAALGKVYPEGDPTQYGYELDVKSSAAIDDCLSRVEKVHGPITHAVANAGIVAPGSILDISDDMWQNVLDVNLTGAMYFCRASVKRMATRKHGALVTVASIGGLFGKEARVAYGASKAGLINMTRAIALDAGAHGIRANVVAPGVVDTPIQDRNRSQFNSIKEGIPLKRIATSEEIAQPAVFLLSEMASYITGAVIAVDGGITARYR